MDYKRHGGWECLVLPTPVIPDARHMGVSEEQVTQQSRSFLSLGRQQQTHPMTSERAEMCSEGCLKSAVLKKALPFGLKTCHPITALADDSRGYESLQRSTCTWSCGWEREREISP